MPARSLCVSTMLLLALLLPTGCSRAPSPLRPPAIGGDAGQVAVAQYDTDGDGAIGGGELDQVPSLKSALRRVDQDGDGKLTAEEINARIRAWRETRSALASLIVTVRMDGRPLAGATVTAVPEEFLGPALKPAQGTTNEHGTASLKISDHPDERGVHLGFYRLDISKKGPDGRETIPARYNTESELGVEVATDDPSLEQVRLNLSGQ